MNSNGTNATTVYYRLTGTASNGVDYTNLTGAVTVPAFGSAEVAVGPLGDLLVEGAETVTLTVIPTNTYLVQTNPPSATVTIYDASTVVRLYAGFPNAIEPDPTNGVTGQEGEFRLERNDDRNLYPPLTVRYLVSGMASNGMDYTNLTGSATVPQDVNTIYLPVQPKADGVFEGDETVTLTLLVTNVYNLVPGFVQKTILIEEHATNIFVPVVTDLSWPIGIDYHAPSNSLIVSYNYISDGNPLNFARIYTNIISSNSVIVTNTVIADWSGVSGVPNEVKLAIVQTNAGGFTNGDMYFGSDTGIGWVSPKGTASNLNWCVLTNAVVTNTMLIRGSICVDRTGIFSNQLVAVTSGGQEGATRDVWRVDALAHPTLIAQIPTSHLEGVITLTNDTAKWGPWAGKIITGNEDPFPPLIYTIDAGGVVTTIDTTTLFLDGIRTEDFEIIPPNRNLYACDPDVGRIMKLPASYLTNYVGDLLITEGGEQSPPAKLFILHWNATAANFDVHIIRYFRPGGGNGRPG